MFKEYQSPNMAPSRTVRDKSLEFEVPSTFSGVEAALTGKSDLPFEGINLVEIRALKLEAEERHEGPFIKQGTNGFKGTGLILNLSRGLVLLFGCLRNGVTGDRASAVLCIFAC